MEQNPTPQNQPERTPLQREKELTMQQIFDKIEELQSEGIGVERLDAAKKLYEEAKGKDYKRESALAKLVEYYEFELKAAEELRARSKEIVSVYPGAVGRLGFTSANDSHFNDAKYKVGS